MLLLTSLIYFQIIFIAQTAVMKITNSPLTDHLENQKYSYQDIYNVDDFKNDIKREDPGSGPVCKGEIKPDKTLGRHECDPVPVEMKIFRATHLNGDAYIERKSDKEKQLQNLGVKLPGVKRDTFSNLTANVNISSNSSKVDSQVSNSESKILKLINPDLDNFYDNELIRKLSDDNGKLPTSLKLVIPPDKEPIVVYNGTEDDSFSYRNFNKREAATPKSNVYYDYNYYEDQQSDNIPLNSGPYNVRKKNSNERQFINEFIRLSNGSVDNGSREISKSISHENKTELRDFTPGPRLYLTLEPILIKQDIKELVPKNRSRMFQITENIDDDINIGVRKGTCPPPEIPGKKGCHPGSGIPKNPAMPVFGKTPGMDKDPEYEKLLKGETSEKVLKTIMDKVRKNQRMAVELGICDFDLVELRNMFKKMRNRDMKDCCSRLSGEMKCFLNWMLTLEPSRRRRSGIEKPETSSSRFSTCNQFPKFDLMAASECYKKPSPQYEKLVQRVEEYRDENNVK
ncbi:uncharacterized protein [Halyomorpha halys]|uniref:uncharacterized protein n=1 Tax=Halyomorpha halys TaxID=286706 RepID=UPI0006D4DE08|nr:uncharacterized protein LOC106693001 [Halyomorpha halys]